MGTLTFQLAISELSLRPRHALHNLKPDTRQPPLPVWAHDEPAHPPSPPVLRQRPLFSEVHIPFVVKTPAGCHLQGTRRRH